MLTQSSRLVQIDTEAWSTRFRRKVIDVENRRLLITNFQGSDQEKDLNEPANCGGFGRVRHFRIGTSAGWPLNPLPIEPARKALGLPCADSLRTQVFQLAACNWRCWYCFVDFALLSGNRKHSDWLTPGELINRYLDQPNPPSVIDLTGGQPDLAPEWVPWMMTELEARGLERSVYLWSDDNLSNDYFWRYLSDEARRQVTAYPNYGRVCCFKGFNAESFAFNTSAAPALYEKQFELMGRLLTTGMDLYAYVTLTTPSPVNIASGVSRFVDRLQALDERLPLRTVPLEVQIFTPVKQRTKGLEGYEESLRHQAAAIEAWQEEVERRFSRAEREQSIADVALSQRSKFRRVAA